MNPFSSEACKSVRRKLMGDIASELSTKSDNPAIVLFCALSIYNEIGGMQRFNQRVIDATEQSIGNQVDRAFVISLLDDHCGEKNRIAFTGCRRSRAALILSFAGCLMHYRPSVVFLGHSNLLPLAPLARWLSPNAQIALFAHGIEVWNDPKFGSRRRYIGPLIRRFVDTIVSVSKFTADVMQREFHLNGSEVMILPNATDVDISVSTASRVLDARSSGPRFLSVTRLAEPYKGIAHTICAVGRLVKDFPDIQYEIVGDGALRPELVSLTQALRLEKAVHFLGKLSDAELAKAYERADVFVLPSQKEGFGIVFLEAWKYGLPVICGNRDASPEVVINDESGIVIDPEDIAALEYAMKRLGTDPVLRKRLANGGVKLLRKKYNQSSFIAAYQGILSAFACRASRERKLNPQ